MRKLLGRLLRALLWSRRQIELEDLWEKHQAEWIINAQRIEKMREQG